MILFSERLVVAEEFEKWAEENNVKNCPLSVLGFLETHGMLNEPATKDFCKRTGRKCHPTIMNKKEEK